jgi:16S rRNA (cytosine1402-N4)-methyltransferase
MEFKHVSVLLNETIDSLQINPHGVYVDGTLGGGGHSFEIAKKLASDGKLIGIDRDAAAVKAAGERLAEFGEKVSIVRGNYSEMPDIVRNLGYLHVDGIVLDLGVSSYQLDTAERGFSYMADAPLDMRMDQREQRTAGDLINEASERELFRIIRDYGEEKFAQNIAKHIVAKRAEKKIETTGELVEIIKASIPMKFRKNGGHPAKRTFQAIRIELNGELTALRDSLDQMIDLLDDKGRLSIITFHSLEDRIVKSSFKKNENPCTCPPDFPVCVCGKKPKGRVVTRKPILPSDEEMEENPRSKSAKLRVFERKVQDVKWQDIMLQGDQ